MRIEGYGDGVKEYTYRRKKGRGMLAVALILFIVLCAAVTFGLFRVQTMTITGNEHYTSSQIEDAIMQDGLCKNSLYLMWKFQDSDRARETLPFLSDVEVKLIKPYEVSVTVYEKPQIGYLLNQGSYVYFDKDGVVVEMSGQIHEGVPLITGLEVDKAVLYEKLPVRQESLYTTIVALTKALSKNEIVPKEIRFGTMDAITLVFDSISVNLGNDADLEDKISALGSILSQIEGESGILHMENFEESKGTVTFKSQEGSKQVAADNPADDGQDQTGSEGSETEGGGSEDEGVTVGPVYSESDGTFSTDAEGNRIYTDANGVSTPFCDKYNYVDENGNIITDGYGYIDPYTGSYILGN